MGCWKPIDCWYEQRLTEKGKKVLTFRRPDSWTGKAHQIPCGRCGGCRLERSRQWAVRCMHEKQMHDHNAFVTLTYEDRCLPPDLSLDKRVLQLFMKRLRKEMGSGLRFYACGEYGDLCGRPHYHLLLFNCFFGDQRPVAKAKGGQQLYRSPLLERLWPHGHNFIGDVTFDSAAYVARYILKKVTGEVADDHYQGREPEFTVMSRRPGIGATWFDAYYPGVYDWDSVVVNGREARPPRFYDIRFELLDSMRMERIRLERRRRALLNAYENTPNRRYVREVTTLRRQAMFARRL